jgi:hypothetical protein
MGARSLLEKYIQEGEQQNNTDDGKTTRPLTCYSPLCADGGLGGGANSIPGGRSPSHLHAHGIFAPASKSFELSPLPKNMLRTVWGRAPSKDDSVFFCVLLITCLRRLQALLPNLLLDQSSKSTSCLASPQGVCTSSRLAVHRCRPSNAGLGLLVLPFL